MGSRSVPIYCEHHKCIDPGDFGCDVERCHLCEEQQASEAMASLAAPYEARIRELEAEVESLRTLKVTQERDEYACKLVSAAKMYEAAEQHVKILQKQVDECGSRLDAEVKKREDERYEFSKGYLSRDLELTELRSRLSSALDLLRAITMTPETYNEDASFDAVDRAREFLASGVVETPSAGEMIAAAYRRDPEAMKKATNELLQASDMTEQIKASLVERLHLNQPDSVAFVEALAKQES